MRELFLTPIELQSKVVRVERLGPIRIQELAHSNQARFEAFCQRNGVTEGDQKLKLISLCVIGDDGESVLSEADFEQLGKLPGSVINKLVFECMQIQDWLASGVTEDDLKKSAIDSEPILSGTS